jgi:anti-sigma regulatory factor (Ser/Thr protein kinase)
VAHGWADRWPLRTHQELAALLTAPGCARAHVSAVLREWRADAGTREIAELAVTEMTTNAVLSARAHGGPDPVRMWMLGDRGSVMLLVWDATLPAPVLASAAPDDEHGRGLALIEALCAEWGFYRPAEPPGGKVVWALASSAAPGQSRFPA